MRKLAIQGGLNPLIHGAERCSRNWSEWKEIPKRNSVLPAQRKCACWLIYDQNLPIPTAQSKPALIGFKRS